MSGKQHRPRATLNADENALKEAREAVDCFVAQLQAGWNQHDAGIADQSLATNVVWGSPFGAIVHGYDRLHAIHVRLKEEGKGGSASRFEVERVLVPMPGVVLAQVKRQALEATGQPVKPRPDPSATFSEMALYVLIRCEGSWWVAAAQNTPIRSDADPTGDGLLH